MKLPDKVYDVALYNDGEVAYRPRKHSNDDREKRIKLPSWLTKAIQAHVDAAYRKGSEDFRISLKRLVEGK